MGIMGFNSGLPLLLTSSTLAYWCAELKIDIVTIGLLSATALPYTVKFLWSPLVDRTSLPWLTKIMGRRRSWLMLSQIIITMMLIMLMNINPQQHMETLFFTCIILSFAAATQEIVMMTYQAERLTLNQYGPSEAIAIFGYRIGMIMAGAGALYLSSYISWSQTYGVMAGFSLLGIITTLMISEPNFKRNTEIILSESNARQYLSHHPFIHKRLAPMISWIYGAAICPFIDFMKRDNWWLSLLIIFLYKASDNLIGNMTTIFFSHLGFTKIEIANASKVFGMGATVIGGFFGGWLIIKIGIMRSLFYGCLFHAVTISSFSYLDYIGHNFSLLYATLGLEHFTGGMRLTALFAYQLQLCNTTYAATQLALMTSLISLGRVIFASLSGFCIQIFGWSYFFIISGLLSFPALFLLMYLKHKENNLTLKSPQI